MNLTVNMKKSFLFYMDSNHVLMNMEKICGIIELLIMWKNILYNLISKFRPIMNIYIKSHKLMVFLWELIYWQDIPIGTNLITSCRCKRITSPTFFASCIGTASDTCCCMLLITHKFEMIWKCLYSCSFSYRK